MLVLASDLLRRLAVSLTSLSPAFKSRCLISRLFSRLWLTRNRISGWDGWQKPPIFPRTDFLSMCRFLDSRNSKIYLMSLFIPSVREPSFGYKLAMVFFGPPRVSIFRVNLLSVPSLHLLWVASISVESVQTEDPMACKLPFVAFLLRGFQPWNHVLQSRARRLPASMRPITFALRNLASPPLLSLVLSFIQPPENVELQFHRSFQVYQRLPYTGGTVIIQTYRCFNCPKLLVLMNPLLLSAMVDWWRRFDAASRRHFRLRFIGLSVQLQ